jgi:hypothetical protein
VCPGSAITLALADGLAPNVATWLIDRAGVMASGAIGPPIMLGMRETNTRSLDA